MFKSLLPIIAPLAVVAAVFMTQYDIVPAVEPTWSSVLLIYGVTTAAFVWMLYLMRKSRRETATEEARFEKMVQGIASSVRMDAGKAFGSSQREENHR